MTKADEAFEELLEELQEIASRSSLEDIQAFGMKREDDSNYAGLKFKSSQDFNQSQIQDVLHKALKTGVNLGQKYPELDFNHKHGGLEGGYRLYTRVYISGGETE